MVRNAFVISDIHLGASTSVLTALDVDSATGETIHRPLAEDVLDRLLEQIRQHIREGETIEQCILLGDIFDFSFASYGLAMQNGRWFFQRLVDSGLFEEFVYIPGNHDHHLWQQIIEHYYLMQALDNPPVDYPKTLPSNFTLVNTFMDRLLPDGKSFRVTYPNYHITVNNLPIFLHHGHFLQKLYIAASRLLSEVLETENIEDLEVLNAPFLEFGWYNLCQAYNLGDKKLIDRLYFMYKNHHTEGLDRLVRLFLQKLDRWDESGQPARKSLFSRLLNRGIQSIGPFIVKHLFFKHSQLFSNRHHASTARYKRLKGDLKQAALEYISKYVVDDDCCDFDECVFIFGHTHEPEYNVVCQDHRPVRYHLYNTGGWLVDRLDEHAHFILPQMSPIFIAEDGSINPLLFTDVHQAFLREQLESDPNFLKIKPQLSR